MTAYSNTVTTMWTSCRFVLSGTNYLAPQEPLSEATENMNDQSEHVLIQSGTEPQGHGT